MIESFLKIVDLGVLGEFPEDISFLFCANMFVDDLEGDVEILFAGGLGCRNLGS